MFDYLMKWADKATGLADSATVGFKNAGSTAFLNENTVEVKAWSPSTYPDRTSITYETGFFLLCSSVTRNSALEASSALQCAYDRDKMIAREYRSALIGNRTFPTLLDLKFEPSFFGMDMAFETGHMLPPLPDSSPTCPVAGYSELEFEDHFDDPNVIDYDNTLANGFNWYVHRLGGVPTNVTEPDNLDISNSILTLGGGTTLDHAIVYSAGKKTSYPYYAGQGFGADGRTRYYEAKLKWDPTKSGAPGFPAWWGLSLGHIAGDHYIQWPGQSEPFVHYIELDFFEALPNTAGYNYETYPGTIIDWGGVFTSDWSVRVANEDTDAHRRKPLDLGFIDWNDWHLYGFEHVPAVEGVSLGRATWYFDGIPRHTVYWDGPPGDPPLPNYSSPANRGQYTPDEEGEADRTYSITDTEPVAIVLQGHRDCPVQVDYARVWVKGTATPPTPEGILLDGQSYLSRGGGLTGASDSRALSFSFWYDIYGSNGQTYDLFTSANGRIRLYRTPANKLALVLISPVSGSFQFLANTARTGATAINWPGIAHVAISCSTDAAASSKTFQVYVNGVSDGALTLDNAAAFDIDFTDTDWFFGANAAGSNKYIGPVKQFMMWAGVEIDWSNAANLAKVYNDGAMVDVGADGSEVTGSAPTLFFHVEDGDTADDWKTDRSGTSGNFDDVAGSLELFPIRKWVAETK